MTLIIGLLKSYWPQIAAFFFAVSVGFGMAWNIQGVRLDALEIKFQRYQNEVEQNALAAKQLAMDKERFWLGEIENARITAKAREDRLKKDVSVARDAVGGMRNDLRTLQARLATSPVAACIDTAAPLGELLGKCSEAYRDVSEIADRHAADVQTLMDAWPK